MPVMSDSRSVAANTVVENILTGKLHEFISGMRAGRVRIFMASSASGINASLLVGGESFCQDQLCSFANRFPIDPDDFLAEGGGYAGDRILVSVRNTTGGALTINTRIVIDPVA